MHLFMQCLKSMLVKMQSGLLQNLYHCLKEGKKKNNNQYNVKVSRLYQLSLSKFSILSALQ